MSAGEPVARAHGFSLVEVIVLIVVVSIGLTGILLVFQTSVRGSADPMTSKQALAAAEALLDEIQLSAFCNPSGGFSGAATQANRQSFDDVSDYAGFATTGVFTIDGVAAISGLENYNVSVAVAPSALSAVPAADSKLITVTVTGPTTSPTPATVTLAGYRLDFAGTCP